MGRFESRGLVHVSEMMCMYLCNCTNGMEGEGHTSHFKYKYSSYNAPKWAVFEFTDMITCEVPEWEIM